jgi:hypothetical protein
MPHQLWSKETGVLVASTSGEIRSSPLHVSDVPYFISTPSYLSPRPGLVLIYFAFHKLEQVSQTTLVPSPALHADPPLIGSSASIHRTVGARRTSTTPRRLGIAFKLLCKFGPKFVSLGELPSRLCKASELRQNLAKGCLAPEETTLYLLNYPKLSGQVAGRLIAASAH